MFIRLDEPTGDVGVVVSWEKRHERNKQSQDRMSRSSVCLSSSMHMSLLIAKQSEIARERNGFLRILRRDALD